MVGSCFQSSGCPSEWGQAQCSLPSAFHQTVSNQVGAPASGAREVFAFSSCNCSSGFQSSGCPSEWGPLADSPKVYARFMFPIKWVPQRVGPNDSLIASRTEASEFPIKWVPQRVGPLCPLRRKRTVTYVSNQVGAPASGAEGEIQLWLQESNEFPIKWVPQRVGPVQTNKAWIWCFRSSFQSSGCPSEWGPFD